MRRFRARFKGTDGSLGYRSGRVYDLSVDELGPVVISPYWCPYDSWDAFYRNWQLTDESPTQGNHAIEEFEEASSFLVGAYKTMRRLAGEAIRVRRELELKLGIIEQLANDLDMADDAEYMHRIGRAIRDVSGGDKDQNEPQPPEGSR